MENNVNIGINEYLGLNYNSNILDFLVEAFRNAARLDYTGKKLAFDDSVIDDALKILLPETYNEILQKLQADKEFEQEG